MMKTDGLDIVITIPFFNAHKWLRRAVLSALRQQTSHNVTVLVISDSDPHSPWDALREIDDPRLVVFDLNLGVQRGPYFAKEVARRAVGDTADAIGTLDADDELHPLFVERCAAALENRRATAVMPAALQEKAGKQWGWLCDGEKSIRYELDGITPDHEGVLKGRNLEWEPDDNYVFRFWCQGLIRPDALEAVGGYYGGIPISYDILFSNLLLMTGTVRRLPDLLYLRHIRAGSLTESPETGYESERRAQCNREGQALYVKALREYRRYLSGEIGQAAVSDAIQALVYNNIPAQHEAQLRESSSHLAPLLRTAVGANRGSGDLDVAG